MFPLPTWKSKREIAKEISPITHVSSDDPPVLIIHGNKGIRGADAATESIIAKFKETKCPAISIMRRSWLAQPGCGGRRIRIDWTDAFQR